MTDEELEAVFGDRSDDVPDSLRTKKDLANKGDIWMSLDFTERRVVRDDDVEAK
jgi:hypothetical protein